MGSQGKAICAMLQAGEAFGHAFLLLGRGGEAFPTSALSLNHSIPPSWVWTGTSPLAQNFGREQAGLGGRRGPRSGGPIPGQTASSASSGGMIREAGPGGRLQVVEGFGGSEAYSK